VAIFCVIIYIMFPINFLYWHYIKGTTQVIKAWFNFTQFGLHFFSVPLLLKTFFHPWKRVHQSKKTPGFSPINWLNRLAFNLISRTIGAMVRFTLIFWGLIFSLALFCIGAFLIPIWQILSPLTLFIFLKQKSNRFLKNKKILSGPVKKFVFTRLGINNKEQLNKLPKNLIQEAIDWYWQLQNEMRKKAKFWKKENLFKIEPIGASLAFGYTLTLDKFSTNLSILPAFAHQLVGRQKETREIEAVLTRRTENNCLLVGEPGVGRRTILMGFARAINQERVAPQLFFHRVLLVDINAIVGSSKNKEQAKEKFSQMLEEAQGAGNIILVIDQIDKYLSKNSAIDLTSPIADIAQNRGTQLIGVTTPSAYEAVIFPNEQINKYFEKVEVQEPTQAQALNILKKILPKFETGKSVKITLQALKEIVTRSQDIITHIPFPEKAIDLMDEAINRAQINKKRLVVKKDIHKLISKKTKVPVGALAQDEAGKLKNLQNLLSKRIIDQKIALTSLVSALKRARTGVSEKNKPMGTFLFMGPTGVGKTETAKALAKSYFGSQKQMIRHDLGQPFDIDLFIKECREKPFAVLLLDEFEKAKKEVHNIFLTVFDEGYIKDKHGKEVSFKNMVIICTSNAAAEYIRQTINTNPQIDPQEFEKHVTEYTLQNNIFSPELINRFDSVVVYKPLSKEEVKQIAKLMTNKLINRLKQKEINLAVDSSVYAKLAEEGHSPEFGARPMKRLIANKIETLIAQKILDKDIGKGSKINLTVENNKFVIADFSPR